MGPRSSDSYLLDVHHYSHEYPGLAPGHSQLYGRWNVKMKHYWLVYQEFFKTSLAEASSYRINFVLLFILDIIFYASTFASIDFIFFHVGHIGVWNREQFMFFISFVMVVDHLHLTFVSANFWILAEQLKLGDFDFVLLRPIHSLFIVFFRYIRVASFASSLVIWPVLVYFALEVQLSLVSWILLPLMIILAFSLIVITESLISTLMFWTVEGIGINFLRMQLQGLSQYPDFVYQTLVRRFFTFVLPILTATSAPPHFLLNPQQQWPKLCLLVVTILVAWFLLLKVWKMAINRYESASS